MRRFRCFNHSTCKTVLNLLEAYCSCSRLVILQMRKLVIAIEINEVTVLASGHLGQLLASRKLRFQLSWYEREDMSRWLEYSVSTDAVFCFVCHCLIHVTRCILLSFSLHVPS